MAALRLVLSLFCAVAAACGNQARPAQAPAPAAPPALATHPTAPPQANGTGLVHPEPSVTIDFEDQSAAVLVQLIASVSGKPIECAPELQARLRLHVADKPWREALELLAHEAGARVVELDGPRWRVEPLPR